MTQYSSLKVKLSNSQLDKLKSAIKHETDVILRLSSNMIGNSDDETNFPHKLLLTNRQVTNLRKAFANDLLKTRLPLMKSVVQPLAKSVLIRLGLTAGASATDAVIHKKKS